MARTCCPTLSALDSPSFTDRSRPLGRADVQNADVLVAVSAHQRPVKGLVEAIHPCRAADTDEASLSHIRSSTHESGVTASGQTDFVGQAIRPKSIPVASVTEQELAQSNPSVLPCKPQACFCAIPASLGGIQIPRSVILATTCPACPARWAPGRLPIAASALCSTW